METQIPNKAIKPTPADIPKFIPVTCKAKIPPIKAKGTLSKTNAASLALPNRISKSIKIATKLIGTTCPKRAVART